MKNFATIIKCISIIIASILLSCGINAEVEDCSETVLESFDELKDWKVIEAPGAKLNISIADGIKGKSVYLNYDFGEKRAYVVIAKDFPLTLKGNYEFSFYIKMNLPDNNLEFKLIDTNGNTFWKKWYSFGSVGKWKKVIISKDDLSFAWGPKPGKKLDKIQEIQFAVSEGTGKGEVCIDELVLTTLPASAPSKEAKPVISNSYYPRWLIQQQAYWTIVGVPDDDEETLICEDGTIEPYKRSFTIAPFLYLDNKLITRDEAKVTQSLEKDYLPIPGVQWQYQDLIMDLKIFTHGKTDESVTYAWYTVKNNRKEEISGKLFLVVQPYQVYPPWQYGGGGISLIKDINYSRGVLVVNGKNRIYPLIEPDNFGAQREGDSSPEGNVIDFIKKGILPDKKGVKDAGGFASAAIEYDFKLNPQETKNFFLLLPLHDKKPDLSIGMEEGKFKRIFEDRLKEVSVFWEKKVGRVEIDIPETDIVNTLKSNIAYNLITKDGSAFQPGSRCYDKAWMRDGGMAAAALLRMGLTSETRDFIDWFAGYQLDSGEVPPIIDTKAKDPLWEEKEKGLIEYDSQGEFVYTILQYYYFTKDRKFLEGKLPKVIKALEYLVYLRNQTLTPEFKNASAEKRKYYGILPPSTSHEGYGCEYSYWDDFWALKGWKDARTIFAILGRDDLVKWADKEYEDFKRCFYDSVRLAIEYENIDYIPGSASLGDYDPSSLAGAINYCGEQENIEKYLQPYLKNIYNKYWQEIEYRLRPRASFINTTYEVRIALAYLYMGEKERALKLLRFLVTWARPFKWYQVAEVVNSDLRKPSPVGDMPHCWAGAEYINAIRSLFVYEREGKLILGHGIDEEWLLSEQGVSVRNLPTYYGKINYTLKKEDNVLKIKIWGDSISPPSSFVFKLPWADKVKEISLDNKKLEGFSGEEVVFYKLPVEIVINY